MKHYRSRGKTCFSILVHDYLRTSRVCSNAFPQIADGSVHWKETVLPVPWGEEQRESRWFCHGGLFFFVYFPFWSWLSGCFTKVEEKGGKRKRKNHNTYTALFITPVICFKTGFVLRSYEYQVDDYLCSPELRFVLLVNHFFSITMAPWNHDVLWQRRATQSHGNMILIKSLICISVKRTWMKK